MCKTLSMKCWWCKHQLTPWRYIKHVSGSFKRQGWKQWALIKNLRLAMNFMRRNQSNSPRSLCFLQFDRNRKQTRSERLTLFSIHPRCSIVSQVNWKTLSEHIMKLKFFIVEGNFYVDQTIQKNGMNRFTSFNDWRLLERIKFKSNLRFEAFRIPPFQRLVSWKVSTWRDAFGRWNFNVKRCFGCNPDWLSPKRRAKFYVKGTSVEQVKVNDPGS